MPKLSTNTLEQLAKGISQPMYQRDAITAGIVHVGVGNFHRAHQAIYCDDLLNQGETRWGITGVSLRSATMRNQLAPQDYLYTLASLGQSTHYRVIGALKTLLVAPEQPQTVIDAMANEQTQLITSTITEKGYYLTQGVIDQTHPDILHDMQVQTVPRTLYGYLAAALLQRFQTHATPITLLCCDNIHAGGQHLKQGVKLVLEGQTIAPTTAFQQWLATQVSFCSSMVDRVTPATTDTLKQRIATQLTLHDQAPVTAEDFSQWLIEDNFAGERPPFDQVGARFVTEVTPFEQVKLRFLNAAHSILATLGYLMGERYIHQVMQHRELVQFTECALKQDVLPITNIPEGINATDYIDTIFTRFRNAQVPYACLQVGTDSSLKIQQRWLPSIDAALAQSHDARYMAFTLAAWVVFIRKALLFGDLSDPLHDQFAHHLPADLNDDIKNFLTLAGAKQFNYFDDSKFMALVHQYHCKITQGDIKHALHDFLS